jgi:SAM-dependent methyltransferase
MMPAPEIYTPGYTANASAFMARRTAQTHATFLLPRLRPGLRVLDCGCGPGSITLGLAEWVAPGEVVGMDCEASQLDLARAEQARRSVPNARFEVGSIYAIPFADESFDVVFAHAIFEHLRRPLSALAEIRRVLRPGGLAALRSPDWGGFLIAPDTDGLADAIEQCKGLQTANGGDVYVGRKLKALLREAGFVERAFAISYECYESPALIAEFLALRLESEGALEGAAALRQWSGHADALFAQAWCEALGRKGASGDASASG